jgi:hypothetical protein
MSWFTSLFGGTAQDSLNTVTTPATYSSSALAQNAYSNRLQAVSQPLVSMPKQPVGAEYRIRIVNNGYILAESDNEYGAVRSDGTYVAANIDELCETLKVAIVSRKMEMPHG